MVPSLLFYHKQDVPLSLPFHHQLYVWPKQGRLCRQRCFLPLGCCLRDFSCSKGGVRQTRRQERKKETRTHTHTLEKGNSERKSAKLASHACTCALHRDIAHYLARQASSHRSGAGPLSLCRTFLQRRAPGNDGNNTPRIGPHTCAPVSSALPFFRLKQKQARRKLPNPCATAYRQPPGEKPGPALAGISGVSAHG